MSLQRVTWAVLVCALWPMVAGAQLLDFMPGPISPGMPEFNWTGTQLLADSGAAGNGDGELGYGLQTAPGLIVQTPLTIVGVPGSLANSDGSTTIYDAALTLTGWNSGGAAVITPSVSITSQPVGSGTFEFLSTDPAGAAGPQVLLTGSVQSAIITGISGSRSASVLSSIVTYTGGKLYDAWVAKYGSAPTGGELSWSLIDLTNPVGVGTGGTLAAFKANATGQFRAVAVPEPSALGVLLLGAAALRRRSVGAFLKK